MAVIDVCPQLIAHRGYSECYPENTLVGLEAALSAGANCVEFDVQFSSDGVPYTEVSLNVREQIRGKKNETYTFRQFGLMKPRKIDGRTYLGVTPEGWPHWSEKETVMLFLSGQARLTGLQTTVGLGQGKLRMQQGKLSSETRNAGLFTGVQLNATGLNQAQTEMLETDGLPVDANSFIELVRRAVNESWIEKGVMKNEL